MDFFACSHAADVLRAEALGDDDGVAVVERPGEVDDDGVERAGRADGGDGLIAHAVADDHGIHHAVHLLEDVADEQRDGEGEDVFATPLKSTS